MSIVPREPENVICKMIQGFAHVLNFPHGSTCLPLPHVPTTGITTTAFPVYISINLDWLWNQNKSITWAKLEWKWPFNNTLNQTSVWRLHCSYDPPHPLHLEYRIMVCGGKQP